MTNQRLAEKSEKSHIQFGADVCIPAPFGAPWGLDCTISK